MHKIHLIVIAALLGFGPAHATEKTAAAAGSSDYVSLGEPLVLNLDGGRQLSFLQISADVLVTDSDTKYAVKLHVPAIRHKLIMLLSERKTGDIKSPATREEIRQQATREIKQLIAELSGEEQVSEVLFSSILVQ